MKKYNMLWTLLFLGSTAHAQNWPEVKPEARPGSRWWWLGSAVDQKNLSYNLKNTVQQDWAAWKSLPSTVYKETNRMTSIFSRPNGWRCSNIPKLKLKKTVSAST